MLKNTLRIIFFATVSYFFVLGFKHFGFEDLSYAFSFAVFFSVVITSAWARQMFEMTPLEKIPNKDIRDVMIKNRFEVCIGLSTALIAYSVVFLLTIANLSCFFGYPNVFSTVFGLLTIFYNFLNKSVAVRNINYINKELSA